ncbi:NAD(P)H-binding protein [Mucilaginibacter pedocola]|uniref:Nucleoside-diphosphate sugar epimerase n=1 Tax=Mucilaginibacter pedocola TaxID=1792845 RepID=A0A1S9PK53_9SPHI|nr:NAD(P)H-binding protein [Mucilaginibacter pedocola]OOQ61332.1 nucleoside-diphosphate sugar epimerase [Mucilaginibacter pedocola]
MGYKAIIVGASGLVGSKLLDILLASAEFDEVVILVRKHLTITHTKLKQLVINFDDLDKHTADIKADVIFSCLGTTKAKTPDAEQYRKIDHDYPLQIAAIAKANGVRQFQLVSAVGANAGSSTFYIKLKGELEEALKLVGFESLHIYQPSMLYGGRQENRPLENIFVGIFKVLDHLFIGSWRKYRSITAQQVANAMYKNSLKAAPGIHTYTFDQIINA